MRQLFLILFLLAAGLGLGGCAHRVPATVALPSTAAVRRPLVEARTSNARAAVLAGRAVKHGLAAGSAEAAALESLTLATGQKLTDALQQTDQLTRTLLEKQKAVDAVVKFSREETARADRTELSRGRILRALFISNSGWFVGVLLAGALLQTVLRGALAAGVSLIARAWHVASGAVLRFWPLLLAAV